MKARLRRYEYPHTPLSKRQSATDWSTTAQDKEDDDEVRTDGSIAGRNLGHETTWRVAPESDQTLEVTREKTVATSPTSPLR